MRNGKLTLKNILFQRFRRPWITLTRLRDDRVMLECRERLNPSSKAPCLLALIAWRIRTAFDTPYAQNPTRLSLILLSTTVSAAWNKLPLLNDFGDSWTAYASGSARSRNGIKFLLENCLCLAGWRAGWRAAGWRARGQKRVAYELGGGWLAIELSNKCELGGGLRAGRRANSAVWRAGWLASGWRSSGQTGAGRTGGQSRNTANWASGAPSCLVFIYILVPSSFLSLSLSFDPKFFGWTFSRSASHMFPLFKSFMRHHFQRHKIRKL